MLAEPNRTRYDLTFRVFGFPVRVHPLFWLVSALFGESYLERFGLLYLFIWVGVAFVSILVHELGHALAFRMFRVDSHIVLYTFGGLAVPWGEVYGRWRRIVVALAGPFAGFVLCAVVYFSNYYFPWAANNLPLPVIYDSLYSVNLYWGLFNLLPVFPLDGGQVSREVCSFFSRRNGLRIALEISIAVGGLVALYSLGCELERRQGGGWLSELPWWFPRGSYWTAFLFGILAFQSYQMLQQRRWAESHWDDHDRTPWRR
ncbi:MAG: Peptidase family [Gemmataceae bacterium]|nr:Peptidase family [Gemmataceae bacterium]